MHHLRAGCVHVKKTKSILTIFYILYVCLKKVENFSVKVNRVNVESRKVLNEITF